MVSIVIRTKNEERWITMCLKSVFNQEYRDFEVILVDNESTDKTIEKAKQFDIVKIVKCRDYRPGLALNMGIREAKGDYIVCLSGHCIPVNEKWLSSLLRNFQDEEVAGVYGRQEPLAFTSDSDKRDLSIIFGLDRRVQRKDSFFHNANSMIRRSLWEETPFDETITNIEDRVWAEKMLRKKYKIVYEPEARVFHYHGIHQNGEASRCVNVVKILEDLMPDIKNNIHVDINDLNIIAVIPVKGEVPYLKDRPLLDYTIEVARGSKYVKRVIVSTDNIKTAKLAENLGAEVPFLRDPIYSEDYIDIERVFQHTVEKMESLKIFPDLLVTLEITFPFRPHDIIDNMISQLVKNGFDTIVAVKSENKSIWKECKGKIKLLDEGLTPRIIKDPTYLELRGVCCATHPEFIRVGNLFGQNIGIYEVSSPVASIEVRNDADIKVAELLIDKWLEKKI